MLREVNHRVKNNLQIIISLLKMQMLQTDRDEIKKSYIETITKLESISLIHNMLYSNENYRNVSGKKYLEDLIDFIMRTYSETENIIIEHDIDENNIETDTAVTLGIITNEIITNSVKYAFNDQEEKIIRVSLKAGPDDNIYSVSDNGKGIPDEFLHGKDSSLGLSLIRSLCNQLKAELTIQNEKGTKYKIIFS